MVEVTSTVLGKEKSTGKRIMIRPFVTSTASVSVKYGMTINLGDYESARVDVMITSPCYKEEIVPVYRQTRDLAENLIQREIDKITTTLKDG
jgi:hypothetical protein